MNANPNIFVVIPALNEAKRILGVIKELLNHGFQNIIVVNDGSDDNTDEVLSGIKEVTLIDHMINLGPGASTMTGIEYALSKDADIIAMMDADHQHHPKDLFGLIDELTTNNLDMVIGSRFLKRNDIPKVRQFYNYMGNWVSYFKTGLFLSDSQSGMKVISSRFANELNIDYNGFEYCIDMIKKAKLSNQSIGEQAIDVTYTKETMSKGQSFRSGIMMLGRLLKPF